jgi:hypothetical protein
MSIKQSVQINKKKADDVTYHLSQLALATKNAKAAVKTVKKCVNKADTAVVKASPNHRKDLHDELGDALHKLRLALSAGDKALHYLEGYRNTCITLYKHLK